MSKVKYKKARSTISMLPSDLMDEESDDDIPSAMEAPIQATQQASHSQQPHPLRPSSAPPFSSFHSSPSISKQYQHHLSPSSISHLLTCGETCLHDHQCGVHSLWSTWSSITSNPSSIHITRCLLFLDSR